MARSVHLWRELVVCVCGYLNSRFFVAAVVGVVGEVLLSRVSDVEGLQRQCGENARTKCVGSRV